MAQTLMAAASASAILANPSRSWWLDNLPGDLVPPPCTALPTTADVVIVGAGLTGCATAFWLQRLYGRSSVIVDARGLAGGATGRNGGHLWPNPKSDFERTTVEELLSFIEAEGIECDLTHDGALALERRAPEEGVEYHDAAGDPEAGDGEDEDWGETPVLDAAACAARLQTDAFAEATLYDGARQVYPAKVAAALLRASGATLYAPVRVLSLDAVEASSAAESAEDHADLEASGTTLVTTDRGVVRARSVVVCTNGWAAELLPELAEHLYPCRNQVVMTAPVPAALAWEVGALSVDSDVGARELYMIRRPDSRLCLGGRACARARRRRGLHRRRLAQHRRGCVSAPLSARSFPAPRRGSHRGRVDGRARLHARQEAARGAGAPKRLCRRRLLRARHATVHGRRQGARSDGGRCR